ncbi:MAG TPA: NADP-dependent malic enzyme [Candidatus Absconditabacterales bacterium]|nr:NADP-dependent malic enzyme [Candidatus Absconditabacterales bacterium]
MNIYEKSLELHEKYEGKLAVVSKVPLETADDLSTYYSPGVAEPCRQIASDPSLAYKYTWKKNTVAVVSDGTAVLGLGNIGGLASLPVMEGKAILFKEFGGIDAVPIVLSTQDPQKIIEVVEAIAPTFGGINLEDIGAPQCFMIEEELKKRLNIPVFHDDQHGTAVVTLAGLINALKLAEKKLSEVKIVVSGAGAAGLPVVKLIALAGATNIIVFDSKGSIHSARTDLNDHKKEILHLNKNNETGSLAEVLVGADIFIGLSGQPDTIKAEEISKMADKPIIFALSNPDPEVHPLEAKKGGAFIIATGRSDFPNQLNNVLVFPGIFKGAFQNQLKQITDEHKIKAAYALANYTTNPSIEAILPSPLDKNVATIIANSLI